VRLFHFSGENGVTNFGDELNHDLWRHFLPGAFDHDDETLFVGIGTLLNDRLPRARQTVIFGAGVGYYGPPQPDPGWKVYCVRGPLSARALGLSAEAAVTDPAALVSRLPNDRHPSPDRWKYAFMPHWQTEPRTWAVLCEAIDFGFIDPRWPPRRVLEALCGTEILLTEAMHGAIVADALRIPWIPIRTRQTIRAFKWEDWCRSLEIEYCPCPLPTIWPKPLAAGPVRRVRRWARLKLVGKALLHVARRERPSLSRAHVLEARICELEQRLTKLKIDQLSNSSSTSNINPHHDSMMSKPTSRESKRATG
jgi:succinoglycan biosynthesis protein ExoV